MKRFLRRVRALIFTDTFTLWDLFALAILWKESIGSLHWWIVLGVFLGVAIVGEIGIKNRSMVAIWRETT